MFLCVCVFFLLLSAETLAPCPRPLPKGIWNAGNPLLGKQFAGAFFLCVRGLPKSFVYALVSACQRAPYTKEFLALKPLLGHPTRVVWRHGFRAPSWLPRQAGRKAKNTILNRHEKKHTKKKHTKEYVPNRPRGHLCYGNFAFRNRARGS